MEEYNIQDKSTIMSLEREDTEASVKEALLESNPLSDEDRLTFTDPGSLDAEGDEAKVDATKQKLLLLQSQMAKDADCIETVAADENITTVEEILDAEKGVKPAGNKPEWRRKVDRARTKLVFVRSKATSAYRVLQHRQPVPEPAPKPEPEPTENKNKPPLRKAFDFFCVFDDVKYTYCCLYIGYGTVVLGLILMIVGVSLLWLYGNKKASSVYGLPIWLGLLLIVVAGLIIANSQWQKDIDDVAVENEEYEEEQEEKKKEDELHEEERKLLEEIVVEQPVALPAVVVEDDPQKTALSDDVFGTNQSDAMIGTNPSNGVIGMNPSGDVIGANQSDGVNGTILPDDVIGPFYGACLEETEILDEDGKAVRLTEEEVYASLLEVVPADKLRSIQCIRRLWRLHFLSENVKNQIVADGMKIRGKQVAVLDYTSFTLKKRKTLRKPPTPSPKLVRLTITALPDSVEDSVLRKGLKDLGCKVKGEVERLSLTRDGQETFCYNGTRVVYVEKSDEVQIRKNMVLCGHRVSVAEGKMGEPKNSQMFDANGNENPETPSAVTAPEEENGEMSNGSRFGDSGIQTPDSGFQTPETRSELPLQLPATLEENTVV
ncbi:uncharacterized protein LOC118407001 [Branchiostoma floridae]|uniref:Uncharacterized protein LOC118407001 n=1 Tax=Branchiostoma floridae TaxID=7739 RepID=A0A9J7HSK7_BRAFL|nr:uncharacterized protein LOC118407001 [Branchiostoma floridae]